MKDKKKDIESLLSSTRHWNGGAGLIIPPHAAKLLRSMGFKKNYTEAKPVEIEEWRKR